MPKDGSDLLEAIRVALIQEYAKISSRNLDKNRKQLFTYLDSADCFDLPINCRRSCNEKTLVKTSDNI